ncbi:MAG: AAA family ATPase [Micrococcales bacterium]|nr:AAA family ATPase [Micrococcales bacterium]
MATIIFDKLATKLDGSIKAAVMGFLEKLSEDDTLPGLHIEPLHQPADSRVRTGRVNRDLRAVLFRLSGEGEPHYLFHGVWPHDQAIAKAKTLTLAINPINGQAMIRETAGQAAVAEPSAKSFTHQSADESSWLEKRGFYADGLVAQLGLPGEVAARAMAVTSEDRLMTLAELEHGWVADVLLDLAAQTPLSEIVDKLELNAPTTQATSEDDKLIEALQTPVAQGQFTFIGSQDELRQVIEGGDFGQWRKFLHPEQRRYATRSSSGPFRLTGAAGTGKTVVLIHRAKMLIERDPGSRVVMTTFTRNLSDSLRESLADLDHTIPLATFGQPGVSVFGVDAMVAAVLRLAGTDIGEAVGSVLGHPRLEVAARTNDKAWSNVIDLALASLPPEIANDAFFQAEYATIVLPGRITTLDQYLRVRRSGRGVALNRDKRKAVWDVIANYRAQARVLGTVDFPEAAGIAAAWLETRGGEPLADHVLVDEGQDLSAPQWQFLRALVPQGPDDLFVAEDAHQRIYGQRITLGHYGIQIVGRSRRLTLNYRTTAQNLRAAMKTLEGGDYRDIEDESQTVQITGYRSARSGPEPVVVTVDTRDEEAAETARHVSDWLAADSSAPETIAVLVHDQRSRDHMVEDLVAHGIPARSVDRGKPQPGKVLVLTMHRAKGLEFSKVVIAGHGAWPGYFKGLIKDWDPSMQDEADLHERSLIYVAMTRARDQLVVISQDPKD